MDEREQPLRRRQRADSRQRLRDVRVHDGRPVGVEIPARMRDKRLEELGRALALHQVGGSFQGIEAGVERPVGYRSHVLHVDAVDFVDLAYHEVQKALVGQLDDKLVDRASRPPFEDVDSYEVAPYRPDPAGYGTQRTRTVWHPNTDNVSRHAGKATRST